MGLFDILNTDFFGSSNQQQPARPQQQQQTSQGPGLGTLLGVGGLAALAGSILPRSVARSAALMGVGAVAYNFYQKWSQRSTQQVPAQQPQPWGQPQQPQPWGQPQQPQPWGQPRQPQPYTQPQGQPWGQQQAPGRTEVNAGLHQFGDDAAASPAAAADPAAELMLRAMIYAARADGHIDATERGRIDTMARQFLPDQRSSVLVNELLNEPINLEALTAGVDTVEQKEDIYRLSCLVIDIDHFMERGYLDALARSLSIAPERQQALEQEVVAVKAQLDQNR